tara:strand:+ start:140 stop:496 length:357 start_codon:yes stop_codon:yes gene_type:complete
MKKKNKKEITINLNLNLFIKRPTKKRRKKSRKSKNSRLEDGRLTRYSGVGYPSIDWCKLERAHRRRMNPEDPTFDDESPFWIPWDIDGNLDEDDSDVEENEGDSDVDGNEDDSDVEEL